MLLVYSLLIGQTVGVVEPIQLHSDVLVGELAGTLHTCMEVPQASGYELSTGESSASSMSSNCGVICRD